MAEEVREILVDNCGKEYPMVKVWICPNCGHMVDEMADGVICSDCGKKYENGWNEWIGGKGWTITYGDGVDEHYTFIEPAIHNKIYELFMKNKKIVNKKVYKMNEKSTNKRVI